MKRGLIGFCFVLGPHVLNSTPKNGGAIVLFRIVFCSIHDNSATQKDIVMVLGLITKPVNKNHLTS